MQRRADCRGQATVEWIAIVLAISAVLCGATWLGAPQALRIAQALAPDAPPYGITDQQVADAVMGRPGALSPLGAIAWLRDDDASAAPSRLVTAVATTMQVQHPTWGRELHVAGAPIRGRRSTSTVQSTGTLQVRVVTFADERALTRDPSLADRAGAAGTNLAWQGAGALARRITRPLGLVVSAVQLAAGMISGDDALPAGVRAGDIVVCRAALIEVHGGVLPGRQSHHGWRVGVLRDGRLILDAVVSDNPCAAPAGT